ncbi:hypothetical protein [Rubrivivax gelatinosus]|uniref:hypothetical protein n=1 Tax=Rubrivivax gelatinosus TaxID=28068 RepID=UPI0005C15C1A|nr:hypothetical protein [Rubrivivax gelatinosus]MBG6083050.1 hypothetical protein [Rubrivivax gelatinosus]
MIRLLLLIAAISGSVAVLKLILDQQQPMTLYEAAETAGSTARVATDVIDKAAWAADVVSDTAQKGVQASDAAWDFISSAAQSASRRFDVATKSEGEPAGSETAQTSAAARAPAQKGQPHSKADAEEVLPLEQALPEPAESE